MSAVQGCGKQNLNNMVLGAPSQGQWPVANSTYQEIARQHKSYDHKWGLGCSWTGKTKALPFLPQPSSTRPTFLLMLHQSASHPASLTINPQHLNSFARGSLTPTTYRRQNTIFQQRTRNSLRLEGAGLRNISGKCRPLVVTVSFT